MRSHIAEAEQRHGTCEHLWRHVAEQEADASAGLGEDAGADTPRSELDLDDTSDAPVPPMPPVPPGNEF